MALILSAASVSAQTGQVPDFTQWEAAATRIEQVLAVGAASDAVLDSLRAEVVDWRERFLVAKNANTGRLATVQRRLDAIGPAPAEGQTEPDPVAEERSQLEAQLKMLKDPEIKSGLAFTHADGLVREIDEAMRERQATALARRLPPPVNPLNWAAPLAEITGLAIAVPKEIAALFATEESRNASFTRLPTALLVGLFGTLLMVRAAPWTNGILRIGGRVSNAAMQLVVEAVGVILQLVLPLGGLLLLMTGIGMSGVLGDTGNDILRGVAVTAVNTILGFWLVARVYPRSGGEVHSVSNILPARLHSTARRMAMALVLVLATELGLETTADALRLSDRTSGYLSLVLVFAAAVVILQLSRLYRSDNVLPAQTEDTATDEDGVFIRRVIALMAQIARLVAVGAPIAGLAGYMNAAEAAIFPAGYTFLLFAAIGLLQALCVRLFTLASGGQASGLAPIIAGGMLGLVAMPVLALIWGARPADLYEVWAKSREGFTLGGVTLSPTVILLFVAIFAAGYTLTRFVQGLLSQTILPKTRLDIGAQRAITSGAGYIGAFLAIVVAITSTGIDLSSVAIVAGALSVGIGFGLQTVVSNFVSGIILLIERPISEGDWIEVGGQMGIVKRISVRSTRIETFDRTDLIVPNSDLISGRVINWTRGNLVGRVIVPVGVAYGSDTRKVEQILRDIAEDHPMVSITPPPLILFIGFGASSLNFEIRAILRDINFLLSVRSEMNHQIAERFAAEGIEIPFPQQDLWLRNPETLRPPVVASAAAEPARPPAELTPPARELMQPGDLDGAVPGATMGEGGDGAER